LNYSSFISSLAGVAAMKAITHLSLGTPFFLSLCLFVIPFYSRTHIYPLTRKHTHITLS
jgi:hypothetical protein